MELKYTNEFNRGLKRFKQETELIHIFSKKINYFKRVNLITEVQELVKIRKTKSHYRIKIKLTENEVYRIGIIVLKSTVWLVCIENDKRRFYKNFP